MQLEGREIPCCTCCSPLQVGLLLHSGNDAEISLSKRKVGGCGWCADTNESYETEPIASITGGYAGTDKTFDSHSVYWGVATILFGFIVFGLDAVGVWRRLRLLHSGPAHLAHRLHSRGKGLLRSTARDGHAVHERDGAYLARPTGPDADPSALQQVCVREPSRRKV